MALGSDGAPLRKNVGEAALYGVYYDDTEYDYMQHLRAINDNENSKRGGVDEDDDVEAVWIPSAVQPKDRAPKFALKEDAPTTSAQAKPDLMLPASVFASAETPLSQHYENEPQGLQPDMDPHLRQTLEALDDEAFVDDELDDDFFANLVQEGPWSGERGADDDWRDQAPEGDAIWLDPLERAQREKEAVGGDESALSLEARVALFKAQQLASRHSDDDEEDEDDGDTLGEMGPSAAQTRARPTASVSSSGSALGKKGKPGALARRAASMREGSVGGGSTVWSMTSSSMFRNDALTDLDSRFDQVIREYGGQATGDAELDALTGAFTDMQTMNDDEDGEELDYDTVEKLTRSDLDAILDDFLDNHEVIAGKLRPTLGDRNTTADEKLTMIRQALGEARIVENDDDVSTPASENPFLNPSMIRANREKWDVETIQTTKTNLENHPRTITAAESVRGSVACRSTASAQGPKSLQDQDQRIPKIRIHPRTGMPQVVGYTTAQKDQKRAPPPPVREEAEEEEEEYESDGSEARPRVVAKRDRNESKEERKARKEAQKLEKQIRRQEKSAAKKAFADEHKRQSHSSRRQAESRGGATGMHLA